MVNIAGLTIDVSQGDYFPLRVHLTSPDGSPYVLKSADTVTFAILDKNLTELVVTNTGETYADFIVPTDMPPKQYKYDVSVNFGDEKVRTLNWVAYLNIREVARR